MRTICVYLLNTLLTDKIIDKICSDFPCFVSKTKADLLYSEYSILCREEDVVAIQNRLARFV